MFIKINSKKMSITLCKLFFKTPINRSLNNSDYNWIYSMKKFNYNDCGCNDISECSSNKKLKESVTDINYNLSLLKQMSTIKNNYM
jgi:hypothetical protein